MPPFIAGHSRSSRLVHQPLHASRRGLLVRPKRFNLGRDEAQAEADRGHLDGVPQESRGTADSRSGEFLLVKFY